MGVRTLILSDLHLGRGWSAAGTRPAIESLAELWQDVDHLVLNGDVAEIHHPKLWPIAARSLMHLIDRCDHDGVALTVLSGNHDPWLSSRRHLLLAGGRVLVTHGDVMHPAVAPWSPAAGRMRQAYHAAVDRLPREIRDRLEGRLDAARHASFAEWDDEDAIRREAGRSTIGHMLLRPWSIAQVLLYWRAFPKLAAEFAAAHTPEARIVVTGHTHRPGRWRIGERIVLNTGSFVAPVRPRAVLLADDAVSMHRIIRHRDGWMRLPEPEHRVELPAGTDMGVPETGPDLDASIRAAANSAAGAAGAADRPAADDATAASGLHVLR
jgi:UDP-2,3-diacylglucosamine pyrophosphatase LpxH